MISIRILNSDNAPEFRELRLMALTHDPDSFLNTIERETSWPVERYSSDLWYSQMNFPFGYYGAWSGTTLVGYIKVAASGLVKQRHVAFLYNLYVCPKHRHQKVGSTLIHEVLSILKKHQVEYVYITCIASNTSALAFYHQIGFIQTGMIPHCVKWNGRYDDEVQMCLELSTSDGQKS
jgi:ribosomal protein S18 acetylase RimI-like enzyme